METPIPLPGEAELQAMAIRIANELSPNASAAVKKKLGEAFLLGYGKAIMDILKSGAAGDQE